jgi:hypothetical protein
MTQQAPSMPRARGNSNANLPPGTISARANLGDSLIDRTTSEPAGDEEGAQDSRDEKAARFAIVCYLAQQ